MPRPLQPLAEYVPARCPPSARRVGARAAAGELGAAVSGPRWHPGAGVQGSGPRAAATGRRGRHLARVGDSQRNSVRRGNEKRASRAAGLSCARLSSRENRGGCEAILLKQLGSSRRARGLRGVVCVVDARAGPRVLQPPSPRPESFCWFVYFIKILHLQS